MSAVSAAGKPFAPAAERNAGPILEVLRSAFADATQVLEIGSGTGQHAVHFAAAMPWLQWQCSDVAENLPGIRRWLDEAALPNTPPPLHIDANRPWPAVSADAVFSANTLHIMSWPEVEQMFSRLAEVLAVQATLVIYGPFRKGGEHTAPSNAVFESSLQAEVPHRAIRDMAEVDALAGDIGLRRIGEVAMPANNFCLLWRREA